MFDNLSEYHVLDSMGVIAGIFLFLVIPWSLNIFLHLSNLVAIVLYWANRVTTCCSVGRSDWWIPACQAVCSRAVKWFGIILHGFEVEGFHNIPEKGPAILVNYHAELPMDSYFLLSKLVLLGRPVKGVLERSFFKVPGIKQGLICANAIKGSPEECRRYLEDGYLVLIHPGGCKEAFFSDSNYKLDWSSRPGFAKLAANCGVPIIPIFTRNVREIHRFAKIEPLWTLSTRFYKRFKYPIAPPLGGFPVKLKMFIGEPIYPGGDGDFRELHTRTQEAMRQLIWEHQIVPGSILRGLRERVTL